MEISRFDDSRLILCHEIVSLLPYINMLFISKNWRLMQFGKNKNKNEM